MIGRFLGAAPPPAPAVNQVTPSGAPGLFGLGVGTPGASSGPPTPIATVMAIINVISQTCGQLPRHITRADVRDKRTLDTSQWRHLLYKPNGLDAMRGNTFWEAVFASVEGWGNAYIWVDRTTAGWRGVRGLHFLMPQRVQPFRDDNRTRYRLEGDDQRSRTPDEVAHIAKGALDGINGVSPLRAGAMTHELTIQAERTGLTFFRRGTTTGGVVMHPEKLNQPQVDEFYDNFRRFHQGGRNAGNVLLLQGNAKYERIGIPPSEAQFLETRQFQREEILGWYAPGMPHHLLGWRSSASSWGTGVEQQSIAFVKFVLLSRLRRVEEMIETDFLPDDLRYRFDVVDLMRGDSKARSEVYGRMRQLGVLSADEWRLDEAMAPRDIPDDYLNPLNMTSVPADGGQVAMPAAPPDSAPGSMFELVSEMRCQNPDCRTRKNGGRGALLARNVGAASVVCRACGEETVLRAGETVRDMADLEAALDEELAMRLTNR